MTLPALLLLGISVAQAQGTMGGPSTGPGSRPMGDLSIRQLSLDLLESDRSERIFAVRELNRLARSNLRLAEGPLQRDSTAEALSTLSGLDELAAPACILGLRHPELVAGCALLLGRLETAAALGPLRAAAQVEPRARSQRALAQAIADIEQAVAEERAQQAKDGEARPAEPGP
jgi:hypothetical protein